MMMTINNLSPPVDATDRATLWNHRLRPVASIWFIWQFSDPSALPRSWILKIWLNTSNSAILSGKWLFYIFSGDQIYLLVPSHIFINKTVSLKIHFDENKYFTWKYCCNSKMCWGIIGCLYVFQSKQFSLSGSSYFHKIKSTYFRCHQNHYFYHHIFIIMIIITIYINISRYRWLIDWETMGTPLDWRI